MVWCHAGPGSRLEAAGSAVAAQSLGLRLIGIDRPGYGLSSLRPGRTIADWVADGLAVVDALGIGTFLTVGVSTGGAYALAIAALARDRVKGVVTACAMTDMRHRPAWDSMPGPTSHGIWNAVSREAALVIAADTFGEDGTKMMAGIAGLPAADIAFLTRPEYMAGAETGRAAMFANGVQAYADDRLADGPGWISFDVASVACPVIIVHGESDTIVPVLAALAELARR